MRRPRSTPLGGPAARQAAAPRRLGRLALAALFALGASAAAAGPAQPPRGEGELHRKADEVFQGSEWRQLRRQAEDARDRAKDSGEGWFDKCECEPEKRDRGEPAARPDGCSGCAGLGQGISGLMSVLTGLLLAALVGFILWALWKHFDKGKDDDDEFGEGDLSEILPESPPGEKPSSVYLRQALALAEAGDYQGAIRQLLLGGMAWTERQGYIRYRKGLTNRDYLRALRSRPGHGGAMREVVKEFEEVFFGRRPATRERFQRVLPDYEAAFEGDDREPGKEDAALTPAG